MPAVRDEIVGEGEELLEQSSLQDITENGSTGEDEAAGQLLPADPIHAPNISLSDDVTVTSSPSSPHPRDTSLTSHSKEYRLRDTLNQVQDVQELVRPRRCAAVQQQDLLQGLFNEDYSLIVLWLVTLEAENLYVSVCIYVIGIFSFLI